MNPVKRPKGRAALSPLWKLHCFVPRQAAGNKFYNALLGMLVFFAINSPSYCMASKPPKSSPSHKQLTATPLPSGLKPSDKPQYCPLVKELTKKNLHWVVGNTWNSYSSSFVKEVGSFIGAQWVGVKVGKIICLYRGKNSFDFPIALEQVKSKIILEPKTAHWSGLANNRKFCKSTNVYDCPYLVQETENATDTAKIYEAIKYKHSAPSSSSNNDLNF